MGVRALQDFFDCLDQISSSICPCTATRRRGSTGHPFTGLPQTKRRGSVTRVVHDTRAHGSFLLGANAAQKTTEPLGVRKLPVQASESWGRDGDQTLHHWKEPDGTRRNQRERRSIRD